MGHPHRGESEWQRGESDVAGEDDDDRSDEHRCRVQGHECRAHRDHGEDEHPQQCPSSPPPQTARRSATMENTPATLASSATIVMAMTKTRTGPVVSASP